MPESAKRQRVKRELPEPIPDSPRNIAKAIMKRPPKKGWRYLREHKRKYDA